MYIYCCTAVRVYGCLGWPPTVHSWSVYSASHGMVAVVPARPLTRSLTVLNDSFTGRLPALSPAPRPGPCPGTPLVGAFPPLGPQGLINASARRHAAGGARAFDLDIALLARCTIVADQGVADQGVARKTVSDVSYALAYFGLLRLTFGLLRLTSAYFGLLRLNPNNLHLGNTYA